MCGAIVRTSGASHVLQRTPGDISIAIVSTSGARADQSRRAGASVVAAEALATRRLRLPALGRGDRQHGVVAHVVAAEAGRPVERARARIEVAFPHDGAVDL